MQNKTQTHDRLLAGCFQYVWNNYSLTRGSMFHVTNESKPINKNWLKSLLIAFCKRFGMFVREEDLDKFIKANAYNNQHMIELSRLKAIGVVAGVLDLIWFWQGKLYCFDVKVGNDRLSDAQKTFIQVIEQNFGKCYVIRNFNEFKIIVDEILKDYASA